METPAPGKEKLPADAAGREGSATALQLLQDLHRGGDLNSNALALQAVRAAPRQWFLLWGALVASALALFPVQGGLLGGGIAIGFWLVVVPAAATTAARAHLDGEHPGLVRILGGTLRRALGAVPALVIHYLGFAMAGYWGLQIIETLAPAGEVAVLLGMAVLAASIPLFLLAWAHVAGEAMVLDRGPGTALLEGYRKTVRNLARIRPRRKVVGSGLGTLVLVGTVGLFGAELVANLVYHLGRLAGLELGLAWELKSLLLMMGSAAVVGWISAAWSYRYLEEEAVELLTDGSEG